MSTILPSSAPTSSITLVRQRSSPVVIGKGRGRFYMGESGEKKGMKGAVCGATDTRTSTIAVLGLVDERKSTEGTGVPFGLSNNLLAWILLGVSGLIWAFYIVYTSGLDEDDDSGLSL